MTYDPGRHADYHAGVGGTMPLAFRIIFGALVIGAFVALAAAARADDQIYSNRQTWREIRHDQRSGEFGSCALVGVGCPALPRISRDPDPRPESVTNDRYSWNGREYWRRRLAYRSVALGGGRERYRVRVYGWRSDLPSCNVVGSLPAGTECRP